MSVVNTLHAEKVKYRPEIDGLRAFAVVAVIINHFNKDILPGGYLGVDIFFVISGFVITSSLWQRESKSLGEFLAAFYARRLKRLVPAMLLYTVVAGTLITLLNPEPAISIRTGISGIFGLSNMYLLRQSTNYFADTTTLNPFTQTWSLGVEEQFYLLFPFLIWFSGFGRQTNNGERNLFFITAGISVASLICFLFLYQTNQPAAYFLMPTRFWEMAMGCLLFIVQIKSPYTCQKTLGKLRPLFALIAIIGVMCLPTNTSAFSTIAVVIFTSNLLVCLSKDKLVFKAFTYPAVLYIGTISYSLYLWHWGVLSLSKWSFGITQTTILPQVLIMFLMSVASYHVVEKPLRRSDWGWNNKNLVSIGIAVALQTVVCIFLFYVSKFSNLFYQGENNQLPYGVTNHESLSRGCTKPNSISRCIIKGVSQRRIFLLGDSHALALFPMLDELNRVNNFTVVGSYVGQSIFPGTEGIGQHKRQKGIERELLDIIQDGDIVIISNSNYFKSNMDKYKSELLDFADKIGVSNVRILMLAPLPVYKSNAICTNQWFQVNCNVKELRKDLSASQTNVLSAYEWVKMNSKYQNIEIFNTFNVLCDPSNLYCTPTSTSGLPLFYDFHHLNTDVARMLSSSVANFIEASSSGGNSVD